MTQLAILTQTDAMPAAALIEHVRRIEALGYGSFWLPEITGREPLATSGWLLANTQSICIGTGIANIYARDPHAMAQAAHGLAELSGGRFILGLGVSNVGLNAARGHAWQPPLPTMRAYLDALDAVTVDSVAPATPPERIVAAHGPALQRLAAARADGLMTYLMPPEHTATSRERAGPDAGISVVCPVLAEPDPAAARAHVRSALAYYLGLDYYHREWRKLGFDDADFANGGSDRLVDTITCWGDADALHARVEAYARAGASRVILLPLEQAAGDHDSIAVLAPGSGRTLTNQAS